VIEDLGLKEGQQISEDDLCTLVQATYGEVSDAVLNDLFASVYIKKIYVIDLKAKRDESELLSEET
jgi:hypothetical protein